MKRREFLKTGLLREAKFLGKYYGEIKNGAVLLPEVFISSLSSRQVHLLAVDSGYIKLKSTGSSLKKEIEREIKEFTTIVPNIKITYVGNTRVSDDGCISISNRVKGLAGFTPVGEVVIIGMDDNIEIWDKSKWDEMMKGFIRDNPGLCKRKAISYLLYESLADCLEAELVSGALGRGFICKEISSDDWYPAMVLVSRRTKNKENLLAITNGIVENIKPLQKKEHNMKIIGIGKAGLNVLKILRVKGVKEDVLLAIDHDQFHLKQCSISNKIILPTGKVRFITYRDGYPIPFSWDGIHHGGSGYHRMLAIGCGKEIAKKLRGIKEAIIILGLGGATGTGAAPVIAGILRSIGTRVVVFTQFPFAFEGKNRIADAADCRVLLDQIVDILHLFSADQTTRDKKSMTSPQAFSFLDEFLAGKVLDWMRNR